MRPTRIGVGGAPLPPRADRRPWTTRPAPDRQSAAADDRIGSSRYRRPAAPPAARTGPPRRTHTSSRFVMAAQHSCAGTAGSPASIHLGHRLRLAVPTARQTTTARARKLIDSIPWLSQVFGGNSPRGEVTAAIGLQSVTAVSVNLAVSDSRRGSGFVEADHWAVVTAGQQLQVDRATVGQQRSYSARGAARHRHRRPGRKPAPAGRSTWAKNDDSMSAVGSFGGDRGTARHISSR